MILLSSVVWRLFGLNMFPMFVLGFHFRGLYRHSIKLILVICGFVSRIVHCVICSGRQLGGLLLVQLRATRFLSHQIAITTPNRQK